MLMMDGTLPLMAIVQIMHLFESMTHIMFFIAYIALNTIYWYIFIPMPFIEFVIGAYILWETFIRSSYNLLAGKILLNSLSLV